MIGTGKVGARSSLKDDGYRSLDDLLEAGFNLDYLDWKNPHQTWMIPPVFEMKGSANEKGRLAEKKIFDLLHEFGNCHNEPMFVVHAYHFKEKISDSMKDTKVHRNFVEGEHDFVLAHWQYGIIFLQVKGDTKSTQRNQFSSARKQLNKDKESLIHFSSMMMNYQ